MPAIELYFNDNHGARWRVYDVAFGPPLAEPHQRKVLALGDARARYRLFVPPDPSLMLRSYDFKRGGDRAITAEVLGAQLATASYTPKTREVPAPAVPGTPLGQ